VSLKLHNTLTRQTEDFAPLRDGHVRIYVCGLTPSAQAHLGHARSFLFFDVLRRYLEFRGYRVTYVQNVTDIDDRSIARALETGDDWREIVAGYYAEFKAAMRKLGVREPDAEPYATAFIASIQTTIRELVEKKYAYASEDGIYYRVGAFARYGHLSRRNVDELLVGARIEVDEHKDDPLDFALWKFAKPGEPSWPFEPYGAGRPGWHIECSAMARDLLDPAGNGFDIHGGGADLIFPHHENEIAQSEPLMHRPPMARFWVHGGLLLFEGRKMSKSLGNFEPLADLLERHDPQALRLLFLQTGYRKVMNFTEESVAGANVVLDRLKKAYRALYVAQAPPGTPAVDGLLSRVAGALDDDVNTSVALSHVLAFASAAANGDAPDGASKLEAFSDYVRALTLLGIEPGEAWLADSVAAVPADFAKRIRQALDGDVALDGATAEEAVERVVALRTAARERKDWAASDRLRDALAGCGILIKDGKDGTTWTVAG